MAAPHALQAYDATNAQRQIEQASASAELNAAHAQRPLTARFPDFEQFGDQIAQEIQSNPDRYPESEFYTPSRTEAQLEAAYHVAKDRWTEEAPSRRFSEIINEDNRSFRDITGGR